MGLVENLTEIKRQKTEYIKPENIKEGIEIFGITGTLEEGLLNQEDYNTALDLADDILGEDRPEPVQTVVYGV